MSTEPDWRLRGQEQYLQGATLVWRIYLNGTGNPKWDHDHCEFCWAKFMVEDLPEVLHEGYSTEDRSHWICPDCFNDFNAQFQWRTAVAPVANGPQKSSTDQA